MDSIEENQFKCLFDRLPSELQINSIFNVFDLLSFEGFDAEVALISNL